MTEFTNTLSAGQLQMFLPSLPHSQGCPRKWVLHRCCGVPQVSGPALQFGVLSHAALEELTTKPDAWDWPTHWTGKEKTEDERHRAKAAVMAQAMYHHRPPGILIPEAEYFLEVEDLDTRFHIRPDLWADRKVFCDWKTTSASDKDSDWVLGEEDHTKPLSKNIQANLYALGLMLRWRTKSIKALWIYGSKKFNPGGTPKTWNVEHTFTLKAAQKFFDEIIRPIVPVMLSLKAAIASGDIANPLAVPHAGSSCEFHGKFCDALGACGNLYPSPIRLDALRLPVIQ